MGEYSSRRIVLLGALLAAGILIYIMCSWTMISNQLMTPTAQDNLTTGCDLDGVVFTPAVNQTDPCLMAFIKKKMLISPRPSESVKTIPFSTKKVDLPCNMEKLKWIQMLIIDGTPKDTKFFFLETGAHDGQFLSSTVRLETLFGWNGVLIEPLPNEFKQLLENRRAWAVNAALCVTPHPGYVDFYVDESQGSAKDQGFRSGSRLQFIGKRGRTKLILPCVPLYTILAALNVSVVDFLSLDIEGAELLVLKTMPFDKVRFKVLVVEYVHIPGGNPIGQLLEFLTPHGYHLVSNITMVGCADGVFVHESVYREKMSILSIIGY